MAVATLGTSISGDISHMEETVASAKNLGVATNTIQGTALREAPEQRERAERRQDGGQTRAGGHQSLPSHLSLMKSVSSFEEIWPCFMLW